MSTWWHRNTVALIGLFVLLPVTLGVVNYNDWKEYYLYSPSFAAPVSDDGTVELAGATWGPIRASDISDVEGLLNPEGTRVIAVGIPVELHGDAVPSCSSPVLVEQSTGREWFEMRDELGFEYSADEPTFCVSAETDENGDPLPVDDYELLVPFIVPEDAEGPFWIEVAPLDAVPLFVRFSVEP